VSKSLQENIRSTQPVYKGFPVFRVKYLWHSSWFIVWSKTAKYFILTQGLFMNEAEYLDQEDQEKAVEIRIEDVIYRSDESPAVVLAIKRICSLSGECKVGHVTLGQENTLRLYLET
jgi:hypothetical protein